MSHSITPRPDQISCRSDAIQLWMHLLERDIAFSYDEDPAEWQDDAGRQVLSHREIATIRRLFAEVDRLGAVTFDCYADADALRQLAMLGALPRPVAGLPRGEPRRALIAGPREELRSAA